MIHFQNEMRNQLGVCSGTNKMGGPRKDTIATLMWGGDGEDPKIVFHDCSKLHIRDLFRCAKRLAQESGFDIERLLIES